MNAEQSQPEERAFEVVVVGGGPAGVTAALRASELGAQVALIERSRLGGTCTNDGCVPTRVLAKAARLLRDTEQFAEYGLDGGPPALDFERLLQRTQQVVYRIQEKKQLIKHLETFGVQVFIEQGPAAFQDAHTLSVGGALSVQGKKFILCVGGRPRKLDFPGAEHALTHSDVWSMKELPRSLAVIGASATGCQLTSIFNGFGVPVSLLDIAPRVLPTEDEHISAEMEAAFERRGVDVLTGIQAVERIDKNGRQLTLTYRKDDEAHTLDADVVIQAVGWPGNVPELNLEAAGVEHGEHYIPVDVQLRTNVPHIFAAGDITGNMMLVQSASVEARIAAENAVLGQDHAYRHQVVPHGGFTDPEYGSVGLTEAEARTYHDPIVSVVPYAALDRAVIDGRPEGFCKLIASRDTRRILGAHVVGEQALEIVQIIASGMAARITCDQLADLELAYPTFTAIVGLAARKMTHAMGVVPVAVEWQALGRTPAAEWERRDDL